MRIAEIYAGIEGEGLRIGTPQIFIRSQGCSIKCKYCDSSYTWDESKGKDLSPEEILVALKKNNYSLDVVSITGGNPLEQSDIYQLVDLLDRNNYYVNIEVSGQEWNHDVYRKVDFISCDIKTPSSGVVCNLENIKKILSKFDYKTQIKCVAADKEDLNYICNNYRVLSKDKSIDVNMIITPCWPEKQKEFDVKFYKVIQKKLLEEKLPIKVIIQQHKAIFGVETKGV